MDQHFAILGFGKIGEDAIRYIYSTLRQEGSSDMYNDSTCILLTRSWELSGQNRSTTVQAISEEDILDNAPSVILTLVDSNDFSALERAEQTIIRANIAGVRLRIAVGQNLKECTIEKCAHAVVSMTNTIPGVALAEQMGRLAMALMPFAMVGTARGCMDFFDPVDLENIIQGQVQSNLQRLLPSQHHQSLSELNFESIACKSPCNPSAVFVSLGGCAVGLMDRLGLVYASLSDAIDADLPRETQDIPLASACFVDESLGSELEIVTCVSTPYS